MCAAVRLAPWTRKSTRPGFTRRGRRSTRVGCHVWLPPAPPSHVTSTCRLATRIVLAPPAPRPLCPLPSRRALAWCVGCCLAVLGPYTRPVSCTSALPCAVFQRADLFASILYCIVIPGHAHHLRRTGPAYEKRTLPRPPHPTHPPPPSQPSPRLRLACTDRVSPPPSRCRRASRAEGVSTRGLSVRRRVNSKQ